ncbi:hypothetical protein DRW03_04550 [Corallococcus sp. H22C18031201]|uniref:hypothetical protein n=1 Tax=Citreicoccus inhibens TaxID=2849499 RepID=UPI000E745D79|nr:hypothetical protein [Citreicoccus inhibens]MBU8899273.1 hypothetical protein [Citreicoccus inhibens]RJS25754.1 hypothetical protein DRW03_04550 [Corallococcus sp. H22C18031201]
MDSTHALPSLTITQTVARQTPRSEFGPTLARAAREVVRTGAGLVGGMIPGGPITSAAISSVSSVVASGVASSVGSTTVPVKGGASVGGSGAGQGDAWDLMEAQKLMNAEGQKFNMAYLQLQNEMQQESREHNAISNIMKVRHDSAKAAINNIR